MKTLLKFLVLGAFMLIGVFSVADAQVLQPVIHFADSLTIDHVATASMSFAAVPLLVTYVKDNSKITPDLIQSLTAKYGKIKIITVIIEAPQYDAQGELIDEGEFYQFAIRRPDISTVRMLMNYAKQGKTDEYIGAFIKNLVVGGDSELLKQGESGGDGIVYLGFATQIDDFLKPYESFLANA